MARLNWFHAGLFCVVNCMPVIASEWVQVASGEKSNILVDVSSMERSHGYLKAWVKYDYDVAQRLKSNPSIIYFSSKQLEIFDCKTKKSGASQLVLYSEQDGAGEVVSSVVESEPVSFSIVVPDSIGEATLLFVCSNAKLDSTSSMEKRHPDKNPSELKNGAYVSNLGNEVFAVLTTNPCTNRVLRLAGFEKAAYSTIPIQRLKRREDAFFLAKDRAVTVDGCWSPDDKRLIWRRKSDDKVWESTINFDDGTWLPLNE